MNEDGPIWVGALELAEDEPVRAMGSPAGVGCARARVLVRLHGAPVGYVTVPLQPEHNLTARVRAAAASNLAEPLRRHRRWDDEAARPQDWTAKVTCPQHFPPQTGAGISIIVCTRDRSAALTECLRSLRPVTYAPLEILVVDNAPTDDATKHVVSEFSESDVRIRYCIEPAPGLSRARNRGVAEAKYDLLAFTDDDVLVDPGWPDALAAGFEADPEAGCITGLVASRSLDSAPEQYFDARYPWGEDFEARRYDLTAHRGESRLYPLTAGIFGTGANFAIRRQAADRIGGFDPLLGAGAPGRGGEDLDMFLRLILEGSRICYLPAALVWHRHRADDKALAEQVYAYGHGLGAYLAKRVARRDLRPAMFWRGLAWSGAIAGRMRRASRASQLKSRGTRLAMAETWGVLAGATRFYLAARREPHH